MNTKTLFLLAVACLTAGCSANRDTPREYVEYADTVEYVTDEYPVYDAALGAEADVQTGRVKYSVPRDGDLTLETRHHVIQIQGQPDTNYSYYVWTGDKTYNDDPDLIVDDGNVMVLQEN